MNSDDLATIRNEQDMPIMSTEADGPSAQDYVIDQIEKRKQIGMATYGTLLRPDNGRDNLRDAFEEALDLSCYLANEIMEREQLHLKITLLEQEVESMTKLKTTQPVLQHGDETPAEAHMRYATDEYGLAGVVSILAKQWAAEVVVDAATKQLAYPPEA